jgi:hypothetical protein
MDRNAELAAGSKGPESLISSEDQGDSASRDAQHKTKLMLYLQELHEKYNKWGKDGY